jgi:copper chaperone NosL
MKTMAVLRSVLLIVAAALILVSFKYPMWYMYLDSNNFPKGLGMAIWATQPGDTQDIKDLDGGLKEVNILNHYIGMGAISEEMTIFKVLPAALVVAAVLCLIAAFVRKKWISLVTVVWFALISAGGMAALFYNLYSFGHDLDPHAPIKVQPFMPGFYGEHKLAQFTTYSDFYWGTYLLVLAFALMVAAWLMDVVVSRRAGIPPAEGGN